MLPFPTGLDFIKNAIRHPFIKILSYFISPQCSCDYYYIVVIFNPVCTDFFRLFRLYALCVEGRANDTLCVSDREPVHQIFSLNLIF